jgi:hypothetical protein
MSSRTNCGCCTARYIKFQLCGPLDSTIEKQNARVLEFWDGTDPTPPCGCLDVFNLKSLDGSYVFEASFRAVGYAVLDSQNERPAATADGSLESSSDSNDPGCDQETDCFYRIFVIDESESQTPPTDSPATPAPDTQTA